MLTYSIIMPTFFRNETLSFALTDILNQTLLPSHVFIVDNSLVRNAFNTFIEFKSKFNSQSISIIYVEPDVNSGSISRNNAALASSTDLVAFLDDDVQLSKNYYSIIIEFFENHPEALGCQGYDANLTSYSDSLSTSVLKYIGYSLEKFFQTSSFFEINKARVLPSLCVTNPHPSSNKIVNSQWISTCAGIFRRSVFNEFNFEPNFYKYSWNEYVDFSFSIYQSYPNSLFHILTASYSDRQISTGRIPSQELVYMSEVYDYYLYKKHFNSNIANCMSFLLCKIGRVAYRLLHALKSQNFNFTYLLSIFYAPIYAYFIFYIYKSNALSFFNKKLKF